MRRYAPLLAVIVIGLAIGGWALLRAPHKAIPANPPAQQLQPTAPSVKAAMEFLGAWSQGNGSGVYAMLSAAMQKAVTEKDFTAMTRDRKFTAPQTLAHVETAEAAYVIAKVQGAPGKGASALAGFSLLLKKEGEAWKVAQIQEEPKVFEKYTDLRLSPGKDGGWVVTYQNEKGQVVTLTLPEL